MRAMIFVWRLRRVIIRTVVLRDVYDSCVLTRDQFLNVNVC